MTTALNSRRFSLVVGAGLAMVAVATFAQAAAQPESTTEPIVLAQATSAVSGATATEIAYPPLQAGVRQAAEQGPDALRRYIHRTRFIYAWYYPDFAK